MRVCSMCPRAHVDFARVRADPEPSSGLGPSGVNAALQMARQPAEERAGFLSSAQVFGCALGCVQAAGEQFTP